MAKQSFMIVSNRLPVCVSRQGGELVFTPSAGGLATAMASLQHDKKQKLWIGWPGISADDLSPQERKTITRTLLRDHNCYPVFLTSAQIDAFYNGYANDTLWPLFHYFQSYAQYDDAYWQAYQEVNALFGQAVADQATPDATVWVHDYHLMLLPQLIRDVLPASTIGFFLHIPFPSYEIFRSLPNRQQLLQGLLGADLIGFHIYDYARHFLSSVLRILGIDNEHGTLVKDGRIVRTDAFPIGIDYQKFAAAQGTQKTKAEYDTLVQRYRGQKVVLSVDRLDYSKGITKRLEAYEQFLVCHPEHQKKVTLVMVAVPSRTEVETYKELRSNIEKMVSRINGTFGTTSWTPIAYQFQNLPFQQIAALYARADIALVTPLRDGMNLVAKEFVASKQQTPGVLILSEMAGAIDELPEALSVNPNDSDAICQALEIALAMPKKDQRARLQAMQHRLSKYTVQRWAADFLGQLEQAKDVQLHDDKLLTPQAERALEKTFKSATSRLLLLDYDGTLRGFVSTPNPAQAAPSKTVLGIIKKLADLPNTQVAIISGRPRAALQEWFGDLHVILAAEHGAWTKLGGTWHQEQAAFSSHRPAILAVLERYAERTPGARIEQKDFAIVWHYRNVPPELAYARNAPLRYEIGRLLQNTGIGLYDGSKVIEMKPESIHKGAMCEKLVAAYSPDCIVCIGDDYTDEDMFRTLPRTAHTMKVGLDDTAARHQIASVENVVQLLERLASAHKG